MIFLDITVFILGLFCGLIYEKISKQKAILKLHKKHRETMVEAIKTIEELEKIIVDTSKQTN